MSGPVAFRGYLVLLFKMAFTVYFIINQHSIRVTGQKENTWSRCPVQSAIAHSSGPVDGLQTVWIITQTSMSCEVARYTGSPSHNFNSSVIKISNAHVFEDGNSTSHTSSFKITFDYRWIIEGSSRDAWRAQCSSTKVIRTEMFTPESTDLHTEAELELI